MNRPVKYIVPLFFFSFLIVNCNQTEFSKDRVVQMPQLPTVHSKIDSIKYKSEIYRIDTLFEKLYGSNAFNGNVLIAKGSDIMYQKSFGYGIKETNNFLSDSSLFQLASVSKVITGIGILVLYEQGKLKLNDKVSDILQGFPYKDVTIQHLLSHRSGLANYVYFCGEFLKDKTDVLSNQDVLDVITKYQPKPYFNVGLHFNYSNTNFALLALIIEKISKKKYSDFMREELFLPLGMRNTFTYKTVDVLKSNFTQGYTASFRQVAKDRYDGVLGDKGIYTTTYDLFLLSAALYQNKILSPQTQQLAYTPHSPERKMSNYGFGWRMRQMDTPDKEVFHNGWWHGYRTSFHRRLKDSLTIIVLSNRLNKSVYSTWRIYDAIDGPKAMSSKQGLEEE